MRRGRYRLTSDPLFVHCCHCLNCQRQTGSAFVINLLIETDRVELLAGEPQPVPVPRGARSRRSGAARRARSRSSASTRAPRCGSFAAERSTIRRRRARCSHLHAVEAALGQHFPSPCRRSRRTTTRRSCGRPPASSGSKRSNDEYEEYRRTSYETWEAMAPGWERWRAPLEDALTPVRNWLITHLAPQPGETVLELGAGPGDTGFAAAVLVGERAASSRATFRLRWWKSLGVEAPNWGSRTSTPGDGCRADRPGGRLVRWSALPERYMLMPDPVAALGDAPRMRPGGRLAMSVWGPDHNPWASVGGRDTRRAWTSLAARAGAPGPFSMASEERTRALLEDAGFTDVLTDEVAVRFTFGDVDEYERG